MKLDDLVDLARKVEARFVGRPIDNGTENELLTLARGVISILGVGAPSNAPELLLDCDREGPWLDLELFKNQLTPDEVREHCVHWLRAADDAEDLYARRFPR